MIKDILEKYEVYTFNLELDLLRYFEKLRNEILKDLNATQQPDSLHPEHPATNYGKSCDQLTKEYKAHRRGHPGK